MSRMSANSPEIVWRQIHSSLARRGWVGRTISVDHVAEIQHEVMERHDQGLFDEEFYSRRLTIFDFNMPKSLPGARSLLVVAVPRGQNQAIFTWKGRRRPITIPPTYVGYDDIEKQVERVAAEVLKPASHQVATASLPLKLLAARSGLGRYGRNNICYVQGRGSFFQLASVYTDLPPTEDYWTEAQMMEKCKECYACRLACPTRAIPSDRFLLRAERCIVFHNEKAGKIPFPEWLDPSWHNSLVGCMRCQRACPEDKNLLRWIEGTESFTEEETALILRGTAVGDLPTETFGKLKRLDMIDYLDSLSRNLSVLLK